MAKAFFRISRVLFQLRHAEIYALRRARRAAGPHVGRGDGADSGGHRNGISEKNLPHVFDRFWQADGSSKPKYQGVGIGLALVKELIEVHGGRVSVQSREGEGTAFTVQLPWNEAPPETVVQSSTGLEGIPAQNEGGTVSSEEWLANLYRRAELFPALTPVRDSLRPAETARNRSMPKVLVADDELTVVKYQIPKAAYVSIMLYDQLGREATVMHAGDQQAGYYQVTFDGKNLASGIYYCRITTADYSKVIKMSFIKQINWRIK